ncbi:MAG: hypothetical protein Phog2KO_37460 [Phototrophicaceae bacterium]
MSETHSEKEPIKKTSYGCFFILILVFLGCLIAVITGLQILEDEVWLVPGNPDNFDPIAEYVSVLDYAGDDAQFVGMEAYFVGREGTLDLNASYVPAPNVVYSFYRSTRENTEAPAGVATSDNAIWHRRVRVTISQPFKWVFATQGVAGEGVGFDVNLGMDRDRSVEIFEAPLPTIDAPSCSFRDFWTIAIEGYNADTEAVATIIYDSAGYRFLIQGTSINLLFDSNCELVN